MYAAMIKFANNNNNNSKFAICQKCKYTFEDLIY